jgi:hypothetical protein
MLSIPSTRQLLVALFCETIRDIAKVWKFLFVFISLNLLFFFILDTRLKEKQPLS